MRVIRWRPAALCAAVLLVILPATSPAQLGGLKKKAEEAAKKKAAASAGMPADAAPASGAPAGAPEGQTTAPAPNDPKVWDNYDFVPGNTVLFYTDFSDDKVGNFARGLIYKGGAMDVVERDGVRMLRASSRSEFLIPVGRTLPERFTLELDVISPATAIQGYDVVALEGGSVLDRSEASAEINWNTEGMVIIGGGQNTNLSATHVPEPMRVELLGHMAHLRMLMDSGYFKFYINERRQYNIPVLPFLRDSVVRVALRGSEEPGMALYVSRIRLAESETDVLYDALAAKGRWATQGILFATGKADLQPESRPVLKEIASTLKEHPDLRVLIEGHTDNVGAAAANLTLSQARADAVKATLVSDFGIAGDRITTSGLGDTKPAAPNTTAAGRAQNRRVEVVRQ